jgi:hypothetical protein
VFLLKNAHKKSGAKTGKMNNFVAVKKAENNIRIVILSATKNLISKRFLPADRNDRKE